MSNQSGGVEGQAQSGRGKSKSSAIYLPHLSIGLEEEIKFYGWPTLLPVINQAFRGGRKEGITWLAGSFKGDGGEE